MIWGIVEQLELFFPKEKRPQTLDILSPRGVENASLCEGRYEIDQRIALVSCEYLEILYRN
jgi:hypothetical protein